MNFVFSFQVYQSAAVEAVLGFCARHQSCAGVKYWVDPGCDLQSLEVDSFHNPALEYGRIKQVKEL